MTASAVAADTEPPVPRAARPLSVSAEDVDTELLRVPPPPGTRRASPTPSIAPRFAGDGSLAETRVTSGGPSFAETHAGALGGSVEETVARRDMSFTDTEASSEALQAVLSRGRMGRFVILRELGRGAMGVVLAAYDEELDRKVAIKLLHAGRDRDASHGRAMLLREAQAMARLAHPNVVAVHEVGVVEGAVFVAMEHVAGVDLQRWLEERPRGWREVVAVLRQAGAGLAAAHRVGLIHRDFKPSNVLVGEDGRVRVADFGLAARRGAGGGRGLTRGPTSLTATLAPEGALVGTPAYMAPELLRGGSATAASDQFAFCVALYEGLHGARPFEGDTLASLTEDVERRGLPAAPPRAEVPAWLHAAVCRGLTKAPGQRFASLEELVDLLARDPEAERQQRFRRALQIAGVVAGTAAIVGLLVLAYGALRRYTDERQAETRLDALREQLAALRAEGESAEASRLLQSFVARPENRGLPVVARAYLEWAAAQTDDAAAADAYASAYITARVPADGSAALRGLIDRLGAQGQIAEAAAALAVLGRTDPAAAAAPGLRPIRLAAALARRDLRAAQAALAADDEDRWSDVLADLSHVTEFPADHFGGQLDLFIGEMAVLDFDGDGRDEVLAWPGSATLRVFHADTSLTPLVTVPLVGLKRLRPLAPVTAGEPLLLASYPGPDASNYDLRLLHVTPGGALQTLDAWTDSLDGHPRTVDLDGDGRREVYIGTEAYLRRLWRLDRADDGSWSRRSAHRPTDAASSDLTTVGVADLEGDGRPELVVTAGPWRAYDLRVFKPTASGGLDLIARRAFGPIRRAATLHVPGGDLLAVTKTDVQIAPGRFPPDRPKGEPAGLHLVGLRGGEIETLGFVPGDKPKLGDSRFGELLPGDLDGDGQDELVVDLLAGGLMLLRWRPGEPLRPQVIGGLRPALVHDLDGDGRAEILARPTDPPGRLLLLGAGDARLPLLSADEVAPRPIPEGITDPAIAEAWARAEELVAIGLPRRTATELSAIARLSGQVAPDMLLRTAEIYAGIGDDAAAAEHYAAAANWPEAVVPALAGAAAARRRLGEFAAAADLTRQRLALTGDEERPAVAEELAALEAAAAPRPELTLTFARPLDPRWRVGDPVSVRRDLTRGDLSLWATKSPFLAELPLVWDGGPAALEVEFEAGHLEWGTQMTVALVTPEGTSWLSTSIRTEGVSESPHTSFRIDALGRNRASFTLTGRTGRARVTVFPGFDTVIADIVAGLEHKHEIHTAPRPEDRPVPGPIRLRIFSDVVQPGYVGQLWIRAIRLTGLTADEAAVPTVDPAWLLAEGETAAALAAIGAPEPGSERQLWRIDALLGLGQLDAAAAEIRAALAASPDGPAHLALIQRLRRGDTAARLSARTALGSRLIDLLLDPAGTLTLRPGDADEVLTALPDPDPSDAQRAAMTDFARGLALARAGRSLAAREAFAAALARVEAGPSFPSAELLRKRLLGEQLALAVATADRDEALRWIRRTLEGSEIPHLNLERMGSNLDLVRLVGAETLAELRAELRRTRP